MTQTMKRTYAPVRRNSSTAGKCEIGIWKPTNRQTVRQIVLAARRYEIALKQPGQRKGPLGSIALEVLDYLANIIDYKSGRLDPSLDTMMRKLARSRAAIVNALKALQEHGFIDWMRRYIPTGNDGAGPQVQQTSNAYKLSLPQRAKAFLGKYAQATPLPADAEQIAAERTEALEAHSASLTPAERILDTVDDPERAARWSAILERRQAQKEATAKPQQASFELPLSGTVSPRIAKIRAAFMNKQREFTQQTESRPRFIIE